MSNDTCCSFCNKTYSNVYNFRRHVKLFHKEKYEEIVTISDKAIHKLVTCKECSKSFAKYVYYRKHVLNRHNDKKSILLSGDILKYSCPMCEKHFSSIVDFQNHKIEDHGMKQNRRVLKKVCPLCHYEDESRSQLISHFESVHGLTIISEKKHFLNFEKFMEWKTNLEKTLSILYMNKFKHQINFNTQKRIIYRCHRSGHFQSASKGIKRLKSQGSVKINGYCPSEIQLKICGQNKYEILWTKTHVGHECELAHLRLTAVERSNIASKIAAQMPFPAILDEIRNSVTNCQPERIHLLTKRDLYNIQKSFNKNNSVRHQNDAASIDSYMVEMGQSNHTQQNIQESECDSTLHCKIEELKTNFIKLADTISNHNQIEAISKLITPMAEIISELESSSKENSAIGDTSVSTDTCMTLLTY